MFKQGITDVDFVICNTDHQALINSPIPLKIQLGETLTQGRGAGNKPEQGRQAAIESLDKISEVLSHNTKMVFITAGMGGGTGTGAAPVIAAEARDLGILTVGIVTLPFRFEGKKRMTQAIEGLNQMKEHVDALLVINNEKLREMYGDLPLTQAFGKADDILTKAAKGIAEIITVHGSVNVDFADVQTVMTNSGVALMGSATASGENRALEAIEEALNSPLLNNNDIHGAKNILLNIASGPECEVRMDEIGQITDYVQQAAGLNADMIWGNTLDASLGDKLGVTIIATGFGTDSIPELLAHQEEQKEAIPMVEVKRQVIDPKPNPVNAPQPDDVPVFEVIDKSHPASEHTGRYQLADDQMQEGADIERFELFTGPVKPAPKTKPVQLDFGFTPAPASSEVKIPKVEKTPMSYSNESDLLQIENQPAFKRKNIKLENVDIISPANKDVSRYTLSDADGGARIREENSFLFDNVD